MVLWLPEVLISKKALVTEAFTAASKVQSTLTLSARCAAIRRIFPWEMIEEKLL